METRLTLRPGLNGTKKLLARFGERLLYVRYLYDPETGTRHRTVELIDRAKRPGAVCRPAQELWELPWAPAWH